MKNDIARAIVFGALILLIIVLLCSCSTPMQELGDQTKEPTTFMVAERYEDFRILVDTRTGVMYAESYAPYNQGTFTLLVNADGSHRLYPGFDAREDRT